ncbi:hypothetical protein X777_07249 [Ooceraea biroi]|uniref:Uncharacterized protein n=1 Tax=Ooceraea biroi TaxID=2015173 RepID=A0A026WBQ3_OOCBI|nr:hypothetical protein X777_07249 [Ooceraea biroi]
MREKEATEKRKKIVHPHTYAQTHTHRGELHPYLIVALGRLFGVFQAKVLAEEKCEGRS